MIPLPSALGILDSVEFERAISFLHNFLAQMSDLIVEIIQTVDCLRCEEKIPCAGTSFNPRKLDIGVGNLPTFPVDWRSQAA